MIVDIEEYIVIDVITKEKRDGGQYKIMVEGQFVGFLPYHEGAKIMLHHRFNPIKLKEIERVIRRRVTPQRIGGIVQVPDPPEPTIRAASNREDFG